MDKLNRLRWIPMIVKAYSDARTQQELTRKQQTSLPPMRTLSSMETPKGQTRTSQAPTHTNHLRRRSRQVQKKPGPGAKAPAVQGMGSVLKELRETRKQISRLESMQAHLTELQMQIDSQMGQLFQRLEQSESVKQEPAQRNNPFQ